MKTTFTFTFILLSASISLAQQIPQLSSYMFNQFVYNPGAGGMYESDFNFNSSARIQWSGVNGAPITSFSWADYRFNKNSMSVGGSLTYDKIGARSFTDASANFTYIIRLNNKLKLSMGVRAGFTSARFNADEVSSLFDPNDRLVVSQTSTYPKFGTGFQLYNRNFYVGVGVPDIVSLDRTFSSDKDKSFFAKNRNYIVSGGYRVRFTDGLGLYPNAKIYYFPGNPTRVDIAALLEITDYFWIGPNIASTGTAAIMAGTYISSRIRFMYAYEFAYRQTAQSTTNFNVHEVSLFLQLDELVSKRKKNVIEVNE
jgi:type IX secretion system PorP/SprF family membrane protein